MLSDLSPSVRRYRYDRSMEIRKVVCQNAGDDRCDDRPCGLQLYSACIFLQEYQGIL